jgi:TonB family protein
MNYVIEANGAFILFLGAYLLILRNETDFKIQRAFLLSAILLSLTFPLLHLQWKGLSVPAISQIMSSYFLKEVTVIAEGNTSATVAATPGLSMAGLISMVYAVGILFFTTRFFVRLHSLVSLIRQSRTTAFEGITIIESHKNIPAFSFFNCIVIGRTETFSESEKQNIIQHEAVHAKGLHSLDILLINLLAIFFWFNPFLNVYKKIFVQLHEFEADARAVENRDVNEYCGLLAKVALESAGFKLANHFSKSLTLKRIEMMRTIKKKIRPWKMAVAASVIPLAFFVIACQDQIASEVAQPLAEQIDAPLEVQRKYDQLVAANPDKKFLLMETDENMEPTLEAMKHKFGSLDQSQIHHIELITPTVRPSEKVRTFAIVEFTQHNKKGNRDNDIYTIVDESAEPAGGMDKFYEYIAKELRYPLEARMKGIEGKVLITFIVDVDGNIDVTGVSGIGSGCELEAMRVVQSSPKWIPGKNNGVAVKQEIILPISFKIKGSKTKDEVMLPKEAMEEMVVVGFQ